MPIKFVLDHVPSTAEAQVPPVVETAVTDHRLLTGIEAGPQIAGREGIFEPNSTKEGMPKKDDLYTEASGNAIVGYLGEVDPSCAVRLGALIYSRLNGRSYRWTEQTALVRVLVTLAHGTRYACFYLAAMVTVVGALTTPALHNQYTMTIGDFYGDILASTCWGLWVLGAVLFVWSRMSDREDGFPWYHTASMPFLLWNDRLPEVDDPEAQRDTWTLLFWNVSGAIVTVVASRTLITQVYSNQSPYMDTLLMVWVAFEVVAALGDVVRVGSPYGIPRGWCRWLRMFRALFVIPVVAVFSAWTVITANLIK